MKLNSVSLLLRADANSAMGTGHLMRCLALAQAWQEIGGVARFVTASVPPSLTAQLGNQDVELGIIDAPSGSALDAALTIEFARGVGAGCVIVDGYQFDSNYQRAIKKADLPLLVVDDHGHADRYFGDLILNQNITADESLYIRREPYTHLLLGTRYALLRREFRSWTDWQRAINQPARKVLITLGGSDPDNTTLKVIRALPRQVAGLDVTVVAGAANRHSASLRSAGRDLPFDVHLVRNARNMPQLMAKADLAVSAGGTTCWELAFMGLPNAILVLAENQLAVAKKLNAIGVAVNLGWYHDVGSVQISEVIAELLNSPEKLRGMSKKGRQIVDGRGCRRVVHQILAKAFLRARTVRPEDVGLLFRWANDPVTRRMSFSSNFITWEEHQSWFARLFNSQERLQIIVELYEAERWTPIGQIRIDDDGTVSFSLSPLHRGRHLATPVLRKAISFYELRDGTRRLWAYIKPDNEASQKVFSQVGFTFAETGELADQRCLKYTYQVTDNQGKERNG
jgi:UDP-2,4-diacetamido-2,4,6-trideoxy-beta-L-altropyranose hydrolase